MFIFHYDDVFITLPFSKKLFTSHIDESCNKLKILKMSAMQILEIHLYTKFTLNMALKALNSGKTQKTFISDHISLILPLSLNGSTL